jgi:hypothetical protein
MSELPIMPPMWKRNAAACALALGLRSSRHREGEGEAV